MFQPPTHSPSKIEKIATKRYTLVAVGNFLIFLFYVANTDVPEIADLDNVPTNLISGTVIGIVYQFIDNQINPN